MRRRSKQITDTNNILSATWAVVMQIFLLSNVMRIYSGDITVCPSDEEGHLWPGGMQATTLRVGPDAFVGRAN